MESKVALVLALLASHTAAAGPAVGQTNAPPRFAARASVGPEAPGRTPPRGFASAALPGRGIVNAAQAERTTGRLLLGGLVGGAAGAALGGLSGVYIGGNRCTDPGNPDSCSGVVGFVIGTLAGEVVGIPLGVHLANGRRGRLAPALGASAGLAAAGIAIVMAAESESVDLGVAFAVPAAQIASSILIERATSRRR